MSRHAAEQPLTQAKPLDPATLDTNDPASLHGQAFALLDEFDPPLPARDVGGLEDPPPRPRRELPGFAEEQGYSLEQRRAYIERHALEVKSLDV